MTARTLLVATDRWALEPLHRAIGRAHGDECRQALLLDSIATDDAQTESPAAWLTPLLDAPEDEPVVISSTIVSCWLPDFIDAGFDVIALVSDPVRGLLQLHADAAAEPRPSIEPVADEQPTIAQRCAALWSTRFEAIREAAAKYPDQVHVVQRDELTDDPSTRTVELAEFLGTDLEPPDLSDVSRVRTLRFAELADLEDAVEQFVAAGPELGLDDPEAVVQRGLAEVASLTWTPTAPVTKDFKHDFETRYRADAIPDMADLIRTHPAGELRSDDPTAGFGLDIEYGSTRPTSGCVVALHNSMATMVATINSVLEQTRPYDEIVIVDVASDDGSAARARAYEKRYRSIRVIELDANVGPGAAREVGIRALGTDFVTHVDGDDLQWPTKNSLEMREVQHDERGVGFSSVLFLDAQPGTVEELEMSEYQMLPGRERSGFFVENRRMQPRDMTMSRSLYFDVGGFDHQLPIWEDWHLKVRLAASDATWRNSESPFGTVYNRRTVGLSRSSRLNNMRVQLHVLGRLRELVDLDDDEFRTAVLHLAKPYWGAHWRMIERLVCFADRSHYARLASPRLLGYEDDGEVLTALVDALTDPMGDRDVEVLRQSLLDRATGLDRPEARLAENEAVNLRRLTGPTITHTIRTDQPLAGLRLRLRAPEGPVAAVLSVGDKAMIASKRHHAHPDRAVNHDFEWNFDAGDHEITIHHSAPWWDTSLGDDAPAVEGLELLTSIGSMP